MMPPTKQDAKTESWLWREIRGWRTLFVAIRHWGPLAIREVIDNWCLVIRPNRRIGSGKREADQNFQEKLGHDTNSDVS
jgi:hypothetical protein